MAPASPSYAPRVPAAASETHAPLWQVKPSLHMGKRTQLRARKRSSCCAVPLTNETVADWVTMFSPPSMPIAWTRNCRSFFPPGTSATRIGRATLPWPLPSANG